MGRLPIVADACAHDRRNGASKRFRSNTTTNETTPTAWCTRTIPVETVRSLKHFVVLVGPDGWRRMDFMTDKQKYVIQVQKIPLLSQVPGELAVVKPREHTLSDRAETPTNTIKSAFPATTERGMTTTSANFAYIDCAATAHMDTQPSRLAPLVNGKIDCSVKIKGCCGESVATSKGILPIAFSMGDTNWFLSTWNCNSLSQLLEENVLSARALYN